METYVLFQFLSSIVFELKNQEDGDIKMASLKNEIQCYQVPTIKV